MQNFPLKRPLLISTALLLICLMILSAWGVQTTLLAQDISGQTDDGDVPSDVDWTEQMRHFAENQSPAPDNVVSTSTFTPCVGGMAGIYPCNNVDLLSHISLAAMNATSGNTGWGWTDPLDGTEYAIMGLNNGTAFVDLSDPVNPIYLGKLPTHPGTSSSLWREFKVAGNYVYIVSDSNPGHGMQVFDLTLLRNITNPPVTFSETAHYAGVPGHMVGSAHNIATNAATGYAYIVGGSTGCSGGLHIVNIQNPNNPTYAGCFSADGYTHDTQCVVYQGPDTEHQGDEICFNSNEDTLTIVDVTNKSAPVQLSRTGYAGSAYTHQGWLTEDQQYFLMDDELDESGNGHNTRTYIWDVSNLEAPVMFDFYTGPTAAIDHNLYIRGHYAFESNYQAGLRILDISDVANGNLSEVAYFDSYPESNTPNFDGTWNNYPYFESGVVLISDLDRGLFMVRPHLVNAGVELSADQSGSGAIGETVTYTVAITNTGDVTDTFDLAVSGNVWMTDLSTAVITLTSGAATTFQVSVDVPPGVINGEMDTAVVSATSRADNNVSDETNLSTSAEVDLAVQLTASDADLVGFPGEAVVYTLQITNVGALSDTYDVTLNGNVWNTTVFTTAVSLASGSSASFQAIVNVPPDALIGEMDTAVLSATSQSDAAVTDSVSLTTTVGVVYAVQLSSPDVVEAALPGEMVTFTVEIHNLGNVTDTFDVTAGGVWTTTVSASSVVLVADASSVVTVTVHIPADAAVNTSDLITVTAVSQGGNAISDSLGLTAVAGVELTHHLYLPVVMKPDGG